MIPAMYGALRNPSWWVPYGAAVTWDPAKKGTHITLSNGNLTASGNTNAYSTVIATATAPSAKKSYFEIKCTSFPPLPTYGFIGATDGAQSLSTYLTNAGTGNELCPRISATTLVTGTVAADLSTFPGTYALNDIFGVLIDNVNNRFYMSKNGVWYNSGVPKSNTGFCAHGLSPSVYAAVSEYSTDVAFTANFGASAFSYPPS